MFQRFIASFRPEPSVEKGSAWVPDGPSAPGFSRLMDLFAGCTFEAGLYRLHTDGSALAANRLVADAFPDFANRVACFGFDWLGRQFALDAARRAGEEPLVIMLEPGTGEAREIPASFSSFHNEELTEYANEALASEFFRAWEQARPGSLPLAHSECVGYQVPLFLGGADAVENLEVIDLDVYWTICGQLLQGTRRLPAGATIRRIVAAEH